MTGPIFQGGMQLDLLADVEPTARTSDCSVEGCDRPARCKALCGLHYRRSLIGTPLDLPPRLVFKGSLLERLLARIQPQEDGCWIWTGGVDRVGYGWITRGSRSSGTIGVHRVSYEHFVGPVPDGLQLDHLCRNPSCVNPDHLEPVTQRENILRGIAPSAMNARKTHCSQGHELDTSRRCRICKCTAARAWWKANADRLNERRRSRRLTAAGESLAKGMRS